MAGARQGARSRSRHRGPTRVYRGLATEDDETSLKKIRDLNGEDMRSEVHHEEVRPMAYSGPPSLPHQMISQEAEKMVVTYFLVRLLLRIITFLAHENLVCRGVADPALHIT